MTQYIVRRLIAMVPSMLILILFVVVMVRLIPGTIVDILLEEQGGVGGEVERIGREELEARLGLDRPVLVQYVDYVLGGCAGRPRQLPLGPL